MRIIKNKKLAWYITQGDKFLKYRLITKKGVMAKTAAKILLAQKVFKYMAIKPYSTHIG